MKVDTSATESMVPSDVEAVITTSSTRLAACSALDRSRNPGKSFLWFEEFAILHPLYWVTPVDSGMNWMHFGVKSFQLSSIQIHSAQPDVIDRRVPPLENLVSLI